MLTTKIRLRPALAQVFLYSMSTFFYAHDPAAVSCNLTGILTTCERQGHAKAYQEGMPRDNLFLEVGECNRNQPTQLKYCPTFTGSSCDRRGEIHTGTTQDTWQSLISEAPILLPIPLPHARPSWAVRLLRAESLLMAIFVLATLSFEETAQEKKKKRKTM
eukprot:1143693-Pelagomonas_calceolata.AAC.4